jgi:hypothetical protein
MFGYQQLLIIYNYMDTVTQFDVFPLKEEVMLKSYSAFLRFKNYMDAEFLREGVTKTFQSKVSVSHFPCSALHGGNI